VTNWSTPAGISAVELMEIRFKMCDMSHKYHIWGLSFSKGVIFKNTPWLLVKSRGLFGVFFTRQISTSGLTDIPSPFP